jgi:histidinol-phosphate aminotransferase
MSGRLAELEGIEVFPTDANFILFRLNQNHKAGQVFQELKQRGILVKNLDGAHPLLKNCLRVTVGMPDENTQFLAVLQTLLVKIEAKA